MAQTHRQKKSIGNFIAKVLILLVSTDFFFSIFFHFFFFFVSGKCALTNKDSSQFFARAIDSDDPMFIGRYCCFFISTFSHFFSSIFSHETFGGDACQLEYQVKNKKKKKDFQYSFSFRPKTWLKIVVFRTQTTNGLGLKLCIVTIKRLNKRRCRCCCFLWEKKKEHNTALGHCKLCDSWSWWTWSLYCQLLLARIS